LEDLLESAGLAPGEVHLVVSGADGSVVGDRLEAEAIHRVFGAPPHAPPLVVPKAVLGETWGAAGALAVVAAARILSRGRVPAVPPELRPEPGLPTLHLPREPLGRPLGTGIVLARGSAGEACGLVLCRSQA
jgi:3-oxoacyl-(acyl-carrier-protein) synthase